MAMYVYKHILPKLPKSVTDTDYWIILANRTAGATPYNCWVADAPFYSDGTQIASNCTTNKCYRCLAYDDGTVDAAWAEVSAAEGAYYNAGAAPIIRCANHDVKTAVIDKDTEAIVSTTEDVFFEKNVLNVHIIENDTLYGIADAIREKTETTEEIPVVEMESRIRSIESGGGAVEELPNGMEVGF